MSLRDLGGRAFLPKEPRRMAWSAARAGVQRESSLRKGPRCSLECKK
jgi:hypothetical protein